MPHNKPKTTPDLQEAFAQTQQPVMVQAICNGASEKEVQRLLAQGITPYTPDANDPMSQPQLVKEGAWRNPQAPDINEVVDTTTGTARL